WSWQFSSLTFSDGTSSQVRYKLGRFAGFNSYIGLADDRDTGVFVFVNRDGCDPVAEDPSDLLRDELGAPSLAAFPCDPRRGRAGRDAVAEVEDHVLDRLLLG